MLKTGTWSSIAHVDAKDTDVSTILCCLARQVCIFWEYLCSRAFWHLWKQLHWTNIMAFIHVLSFLYFLVWHCSYSARCYKCLDSPKEVLKSRQGGKKGTAWSLGWQVTAQTSEPFSGSNRCSVSTASIGTGIMFLCKKHSSQAACIVHDYYTQSIPFWGSHRKVLQT